MKTRITSLLGIEHPIFQAAMSWASSNSALVAAVSNAGGMGVLGAGPLRPDDFKRILLEIRGKTTKPYGVNIPLNNQRAPELLDIALQHRIPVMVASQGGPREHLARFRAAGTKWLHVVASVEHAKKAEAAGVDALVVDGAEAGGHPPPSEVGTLVLVRRIVKATKLPVVASGGVVFTQFGKDVFTLVNGGCEKDARGYFTFGFPDRYMDAGELVSYTVAFQSAELGTKLLNVSVSLRAVVADADSRAAWDALPRRHARADR